MKVFNISDVETKKLKQRGLVGHTICVGKALLSPGTSVDLPDDAVQAKLDGINELVDMGILALGAPPKGYADASKRAAEEAAKAAPMDKSDDKQPAKASLPPKSSKKDG